MLFPLEILAKTQSKCGLLGEICEKSLKLAENYPEILTSIASDQDRFGIEKKRQRYLEKNALFEEEETLVSVKQADRITSLSCGRPRMSERALLIYLTLRGELGEFTSRHNYERLRDSIDLNRVLLLIGEKKLHGKNTIDDNLRAVSVDTLNLIHQCTLNEVLKQQLDDFSCMCIDSTSIRANAAIPVDRNNLIRSLSSTFDMGQKLQRFGIDNFNRWYLPKWIDEIRMNNFEYINTKKDPKKRQKLMDCILYRAEQIWDYMCRQLDAAERRLTDLPARLKVSLKKYLDKIADRLVFANELLDWMFQENAGSEKEVTRPFSYSDKDARNIFKGGRDTVFGYKPFFSRSKNGFIGAVMLEKGVTADNYALTHVIDDWVKNTGTVPKELITDDGFTSADNYIEAKKTGIEKICFSGAKGRKVTPVAEWESDWHKKARKDRSSVEALIGLMKNYYKLKALTRRGLKEARKEILERIIVYNLVRMDAVNQRLAA